MAMDISRLSFLIVDDDPTMLEIVAAILQQFGVVWIRKCASGTEAVNALSDPSYTCHCIISDYSMSPMSGLQLLQSIRMGRIENARRETAFIMVTVSGKEQVVRTALALDVGAYVVKPVNAASLMKAIERTFAKLFMAKAPDAYAGVNTNIDS
ncbi:MAG: response regulator [Rhodospirillaceae bacterium]|nr:response regulator [Rhodospirillaceae bacterium]